MRYKQGDRIKHMRSQDIRGVVISTNKQGYRIRLDESIVLGGKVSDEFTILEFLAISE